MVEELGRLEKVDDLRSVWHNEASDFTPWLQANIDLLAEKLGLDIQLVDREVAVGQFSADLVGEETSSGRPVVIENQLAQTDHDHLGKLITYSAGKGGGVIIWVAREIRAEHRTALDWLNGATRGAIDFYGVEVELLRIGVSPLAPHFNVVVAPKPVETGASGSEAPSERRQRYHDFFADLLKRIKERPPRVTNASKVGYQSFIGTPSGRSGFVYGLAFTSGGRFRLELYIDTGNRQANKAAFDQFVQDREAIDEELGASLDWQRLDNRRASRVAWYWDQQVTIMDSAAKLDSLKEWAVPNYFALRDAFSTYITNVQVASSSAEDVDSGAQLEGHTALPSE